MSSLVSLIDYAPTLLTCGGVTPPAGMPGIPLQRILASPEAARREVFVQISESGVGRALRTEDWTYAVEGENPESEAAASVYREAYLYDLKADPAQHCNLVREPALEPVRDALRARLLASIREAEGTEPSIRPAEEKAGVP